MDYLQQIYTQMQAVVKALASIVAWTARFHDNYYNDYQGIAACSSVTASSTAVGRLPDQQCRFVQLHLWTTSAGTVSDAGTTSGTPTTPFDPAYGAANTSQASVADGSEVYIGFDGKLCRQLFPGDSTELIPIRNLSQITYRSGSAGAAEIFYTWFV